MIIYRRGDGYFIRPSDSSFGGWTVREDGTCVRGAAAWEDEVPEGEYPRVLDVLDAAITKVRGDYVVLSWDDLLMEGMKERQAELDDLFSREQTLRMLRGQLVATDMRVIGYWDKVVVVDGRTGKRYLVTLEEEKYPAWGEQKVIGAEEALGRVLGEERS